LIACWDIPNGRILSFGEEDLPIMTCSPIASPHVEQSNMLEAKRFSFFLIQVTVIVVVVGLQIKGV